MYNASTRSLPHRAIASLAFAVTLATGAALPSAVHAEAIDASAFAAHFDIAFPGYRGETALQNFPVLVRLSRELNGFNYSLCQSGGSDLRFADDSGQLLVSEVDTWNPDGESLVWVKVPTLTRSTRITAYYGSANPPANNAASVWSEGFVGV